jgi:hypothetical protein
VAMCGCSSFVLLDGAVFVGGCCACLCGLRVVCVAMRGDQAVCCCMFVRSGIGAVSGVGSSGSMCSGISDKRLFAAHPM